jgi:thiol:disulfide interchange protein DsbC
MSVTKIVLCLCIAGALYAFFREPGPALSPEQEAALRSLDIDGKTRLANLPLDQAIKQVKGDGSLVIVTFEDPLCPYCKGMDRKLSKLDNVTLYTFLYPVLSDKSWRLSQQIWCAGDRAQAWNGWMLQGKTPYGAASCDTSVLKRNLEFGERNWKIRGVPYVLRAY